MGDVYRDAPLGSQIVPLPEGSSEDMAAMRSAFRGRRGATLVIEGVAQSTAAGMDPKLGQRPEGLSPDLQRAMTTETLQAARDAILGVYGVLPGLLNRAAAGPVIREAQRHLAQLVLQPIAMHFAHVGKGQSGGNGEPAADRAVRWPGLPFYHMRGVTMFYVAGNHSAVLLHRIWNKEPFADGYFTLRERLRGTRGHIALDMAGIFKSVCERLAEDYRLVLDNAYRGQDEAETWKQPGGRRGLTHDPACLHHAR